MDSFRFDRLPAEDEKMVKQELKKFFNAILNCQYIEHCEFQFDPEFNIHTCHNGIQTAETQVFTGMINISFKMRFKKS